MVPPKLFDASGQPLALGGQLGRGGEGAIFELPAQPDCVAKIYHQAVSEEKAEKLRWMARATTTELCNFTAWPSATLHQEPGGPLVGFVMSRAMGHEAHVLYSPAQRQKEKDFTRADWAFLVHTAMNCAAAVEAVHGAGFVIGDVNQRNVLVSERATVRWIDCDSFQVRLNGRLFKCGVGVGEYTPPELQGKSSREVERNPNHDRFGLAVLIFHLLFMGRHPFAGRSLGSRDLPLEQAIKEFRFAYSRSAAEHQIEPPPHSLRLDVVSADLARLFERAFSQHSAQPNARPMAGEWRQSLLQFKQGLNRCPRDPGHRVPAHLGDCPWCALMQKGGPNYFLAVAMQLARAAGAFRLAVVWQQIEQAAKPKTRYRRPSLPAQTRIVPAPLPGHLPPRPTPYLPTAFPEYQPIPRGSRQKIVGGLALAAMVVALVGLCVFAKAVLITVFVLALAFAGLWMFMEVIRFFREVSLNAAWATGYRADRQAFKRHKREAGYWQSAVHEEQAKRGPALDSATEALARAEQHWRQEAARHAEQFGQLKTNLQNLKRQYEQLEENRLKEQRHMNSHVQEAQLALFLRGKFLSDHAIADIGPVRKAALRSYGIETALEIEPATVRQVPGFGPKLTTRLLQWRKQIEGEFRFDPSAGVPSAAVAALESKYEQLRQELEAQLAKGPETLKLYTTNAENHLSQMLVGIRKLVVQAAQAQADYRLVAP